MAPLWQSRQRGFRNSRVARRRAFLPRFEPLEDRITPSLINNGGFETGDFTGWTQSGNTQLTSVSTIDPHTDSWAAQLGPMSSGGQGEIDQGVSTVANQPYVLSFWLASAGNAFGQPQDNAFTVYWHTGIFSYQTLLNGQNIPVGGYQYYSYNVTGNSDNGVIFDFYNNPSYFYLDDVSLLAVPTVTVSDPGGTYNGSPFAASGTIAGINGQAGTTLEGVGLTYSYYQWDGAHYVSIGATAPMAAGQYYVQASFPGSTDYASASATAFFSIARATPTITWSTPADITYGTPLSATQLDATANVPGTFTYSPGSGSVLGVGANQTLTATFTPTDTADYTAAAKSVKINVAEAPSLVVTALADAVNPYDNQTSLREAINYANALGGSNTITFAPGVFGTPHTIALNGTQLPAITAPNLTIVGPGASLLTIDAQHHSRVLQIDRGATVLVSGLTVANGTAASDYGGGIFNSGSLTVSNCTFSNNSATYGGGGIYNGGGTLTVNGSTLANNSAQNGGGIYNGYATLTISASTLANNSAQTGGGIYNDAGTLTVSDSTVGNNSALWAYGGGIYNQDSGTLTVSSSTIAGNSAAADGGGIANVNSATATLSNAIVAGNTGPSGPDLWNISYPISATCSLIGTTDSGVSGTGNLLGAHALLAPLGYYGGPTQTFALLPGSPAIDAGSNAAASGLSTDQRGVARAVNGTVDIGAFESRGFRLSVSGGAFQTTPTETAFASPLTVTVASAYYGEPVVGGQVTFAAPDSGPSATLSGSPATIAANGQASVTATANNVTGWYDITASVPTAAPVRLQLTNEFNEGLEVDTLTDVVDPSDGVTSLREAVAYANTLPGTSTITFSQYGTITLTGGPLALTNTHGTMTIQGPGGFQGLIIDGNNASTVFEVDSGVTAVVDGVTITHGSGTDGGGIYNNGGTLTVSDSYITNCAASFGGGVYSWGPLSVSRCSFTSNSASTWGGGIYASNVLNVSNSTFTGNSAAYLGGGIYNGDRPVLSSISASSFDSNSASYSGGGIYNAGTLQVTASGLVNNTAASSGGGIDSQNAYLAVTNTTVANNSATIAGGIYSGGSPSSSPTLILTSSTVAGNSASNGTYGGGVCNDTASALTLANTIIATSPGGAVDLYNGGTLSSATNSLVESVSGAAIQNGVSGNIVGQDPLLSTPGYYGGPTPNLALLPGSPALDAGSNAAAAGLSTDQRGLPRVSDGTVDIGAFESRGFNITVTGGGQSVPVNTWFANLDVRFVSVDEALVAGGTVSFAVPTSGASATLSISGATLPASGEVSVAATANGTPGTYSVTISAGGGWGTSVSLTNLNPTPASSVNLLPPRQSSNTFSVPATYYNPTSQSPAGISSVDLYASTNGGAFSLMQTLPADPNAALGTVNFTFTGADRNTYAFHSIAHSVSGATENKSATLIETSTYVPDLNPPVTHAIAPSPAYAWGPFFPDQVFSGVSASSYANGVFTLVWAGADPDQPAGGTITSLSVYEQIDSNAPTLVGTVTPGSPGAVTYNGTTYSVYSGTMPAAALGDGQPHTYGFFSLGTDDQQQGQAVPAAADVTFSNVTYTAPLAAALTVEKGITERSYIRYLDVNFNQTLPSSPALQALQTGLAGNLHNAYVELLWYGENLNAGSTAQGSVHLFVTGITSVTLSGSVLSIDFGTGGLTSQLSENNNTGAGSPKTTFGDGWYVLGIDPYGDASQGTVLWLPFFRLLGDVTGDGVVTGPAITAGTDVAIVSQARGQSGALLNADVNGDGAINTTDLQEVTAAANAHAAVGATAPGNFPQFQLLAGRAGSGAAPVLTAAELTALLPQAIAAWQSAGLSPAGLQAMRQVRVEVADLGASILGEEYPGLIEINRTAAGHAWSLRGRPAASQVDLRTVLEHELGHVVGLPDNARPDDLMNTTLAPGVRRAPSAADARQAAFALLAQEHSIPAAAVQVPPANHALNGPHGNRRGSQR